MSEGDNDRQPSEVESGMYRKLAEEYSKLKAHYQVLKKLLVEIRAEKDSLLGMVKAKDQDIRKLTQEQESLQFVNGQLNKRVEVLQSNLSETQKNDKKKKGNATSGSAGLEEKMSVLESELMSKIKENEELHFTIETLQSEHRKLVSELTDKVKSYQSKSILQLTTDATENLENKMVIEDLKKNNERLILEIEDLKEKKSCADGEVKVRSVSVETTEYYPKQMNGFLSAVADHNFETASIESSRFSDAASISAIGVTSKSSKHVGEKKAEDVYVSLGVISDQFLSGLSTWHSYEADRMTAYGEISPANNDVANSHTSLSTSIKESVANFRQFALTMSSWDNEKNTSEISESNGRLSFSLFLMPFLIYLSGAVRLSNETSGYYEITESQRPHVTEELRSKNKQVAVHHTELSKCFKQLHDVLSLFPNSEQGDTSGGAAATFMQQLKNALVSLRNELKAMSKNLNHKIRIEHQIEEVEGRVRTANECLFSATHSLSRCTAKLVDFISENDSFFINRIIASETSSATNSCPVVATSSISFAPSTAPNSSQSVLSSDQSNPSNPALQTSIGLVANHRPQNPSAQTTEQIKKQLALKQSELNLLLYQLNELGSDNSSGNDTGTEVEKHDLKLQQTQIADDLDLTCNEGKELFYMDEAQLLYHRLSLSESMASQVAEERAKLKERLILKQQELDSTRESYQQQLSAMSDHVCELNEQIGIYRELQLATKESQMSRTDASNVASSNFINPGQVQFNPATSSSNSGSGASAGGSGSFKKSGILNNNNGGGSLGPVGVGSSVGSVDSVSTGTGNSLASIGSNTLKSAGANLRNIFR